MAKRKSDPPPPAAETEPKTADPDAIDPGAIPPAAVDPVSEISRETAATEPVAAARSGFITIRLKRDAALGNGTRSAGEILARIELAPGVEFRELRQALANPHLTGLN